MKKLLSLFLVFALVLSVSAMAFAAPSGGSSDSSVVVTSDSSSFAPNRGQNVNVPLTPNVKVNSAVVNGETITKDFPSCLHFDSIENAPADQKNSALKYVASLINQGFNLDSGFVGWCETGMVTSCELTFDLKDGQKVFVDGVAVDMVEGGSITVDIPTIVIIAH